MKLREMLFFLLLTFVISITLSACATENAPKTEQKQNTKQNQKQATEPFTYTLAVKTDKSGIEYPQIVTSNDKEKQDRVNSLIQQKALAFLQGATDEELKKTDFEIGNTIEFEGQNLLSITIAGMIFAEEAAHPSKIFENMNVDLNGGVVLRLSDLVRIDDELVKRIRALRPVEDGSVEDEGLKYVLALSDEDLLDQLRTRETMNFYYDSQKFWITFDTFHAIGQTAWLAFDIAEMKRLSPLSDAEWEAMFKRKPGTKSSFLFEDKEIVERIVVHSGDRRNPSAIFDIQSDILDVLVCLDGAQPLKEGMAFTDDFYRGLTVEYSDGTSRSFSFNQGGGRVFSDHLTGKGYMIDEKQKERLQALIATAEAQTK